MSNKMVNDKKILINYDIKDLENLIQKLRTKINTSTNNNELVDYRAVIADCINILCKQLKIE